MFYTTQSKILATPMYNTLFIRTAMGEIFVVATAIEKKRKIFCSKQLNFFNILFDVSLEDFRKNIRKNKPIINNIDKCVEIE